MRIFKFEYHHLLDQYDFGFITDPADVTDHTEGLTFYYYFRGQEVTAAEARDLLGRSEATALSHPNTTSR